MVIKKYVTNNFQGLLMMLPTIRIVLNVILNVKFYLKTKN